jgi:hypothetical protein
MEKEKFLKLMKLLEIAPPGIEIWQEKKLFYDCLTTK